MKILVHSRIILFALAAFISIATTVLAALSLLEKYQKKNIDYQIANDINSIEPSSGHVSPSLKKTDSPSKRIASDQTTESEQSPGIEWLRLFIELSQMHDDSTNSSDKKLILDRIDNHLNNMPKQLHDAVKLINDHVDLNKVIYQDNSNQEPAIGTSRFTGSTQSINQESRSIWLEWYDSLMYLFVAIGTMMSGIFTYKMYSAISNEKSK